MSTADDALWPEEPVEAGVAPAPRTNGGNEHAELEETRNRLRLVVAELDNTRRRNARQAADLRAAARAEAAAAWLPIVDNLERAARQQAAVPGRDGKVGTDEVWAVHEQAVTLLA